MNLIKFCAFILAVVLLTIATGVIMAEGSKTVYKVMGVRHE